MLGFNAETGKRIEGLDHLRQSIRDILTTPIGSRVMRRDYGSRLFELVDAPINRDTITDIYAATAEAIIKWEPRVDVQQVKITNAVPGLIELTLYGNYLPNGQAITIDGIVIK